MTSLSEADPVALFKFIWPHLKLYDKQREILYSVWENTETVVTAGHMLGKDFLSGAIALLFFRSRTPARVITTSVQGQQLEDVLWGEIRWLMREAKVNLDLQYNHLHIRQIRADNTYDDKTELRGKTVSQGEALAGYHLPQDIPRTLAIFDEASGISDITYDSTEGWAHRKLIIGNPYPCENFFYRLVEEGDKRHEDPNLSGLKTKVIRIGGEHSPNVRLAVREMKEGKEPSGKILIPGLLTYSNYIDRLANWDEGKKEAGIFGRFYKGKEVKLFPETWLNYSFSIHVKRYIKPIGLGGDTAEGGDSTTFCLLGFEGMVELVSEKTPDTSVIPEMIIKLIKDNGIDPRNVWLDQGGGGKEHVDLLRKFGYPVNALFFGEAATEEKTLKAKKKWKSQQAKIELVETKNAYKNRRAELYHLASQRVNPSKGNFSLIPEDEGPQYKELYRQLKVMPKLLDGEGKYYLPPKKPRPNSKEKSLFDMLGCSPDEADSFVLANWALEKITKRVVL